MVACASFFFLLLYLCGWLSSDGGADFIKRFNRIQSEATREQQRSATFSYGGNFVKRKPLGLLEDQEAYGFNPLRK